MGVNHCQCKSYASIREDKKWENKKKQKVIKEAEKETGIEEKGRGIRVWSCNWPLLVLDGWNNIVEF